MENKQQHTPIGFSRHILHPSDAELTKQADILYANDPNQQQAYVNGGVWMRNGYNEDRFLKQFEGQASIISELQQRIASLTEQVEQARVNVEKIESAVYAARPDEDIIIKDIYRLTNKALSDLNTIPALTKKGE